MADVTITLYVNTSSIVNPDVDAYCNFGQAANITNEDYSVLLNVGQTVEWVGVSTTSVLDAVQITMIQDDSTVNIFGANNKNPPGNAGNGFKPSGTVQNGTKGDHETYTILFSVLNNGVRRNGQFRIDPKLAVNN